MAGNLAGGAGECMNMFSPSVGPGSLMCVYTLCMCMCMPSSVSEQRRCIDGSTLVDISYLALDWIREDGTCDSHGKSILRPLEPLCCSMVRSDPRASSYPAPYITSSHLGFLRFQQPLLLPALPSFLGSLLRNRKRNSPSLKNNHTGK